jgi:hypothetical protein
VTKSLKDKLNKALDVHNDNKAASESPDDSKAWAQIGLEGGELSTGALPTELTGDWNAVLRSFGLDPDVFEIADDTVRMSKWQSSKRLENGDRDLIWLFSYKARFRRKSLTALSETDITALRETVQKWKPVSRPKTPASNEPPSTMVVCWADQQLGKSAGGGVEATVQRVIKGYEDTIERVRELRRIGRNIENIAIVNMGDPVEGCDGNYASQLFTVELTQREQLTLAIDLWTQGIRQLAPLAEQAEFISVLCNHGEWMRRGGKSVTSDSDNAGGFLTDTVKRVLDGRTDTEHIKWTIPHDEFITTAVLSGVKVAFTHGHKISGKEVEWLRGQSIRILREEGREPDIWVTAHKHHLQVEDFGPWYRFQCPSNDGGSKWYTDMSGKWSTPGTLTFLVGAHDTRGWSDMAVL